MVTRRVAVLCQRCCGVGTESCGAQSNIWGVGAGAHGSVMAPNGCGSYIDTGAPIMLFESCRIEDEWVFQWVAPLLNVLEPSSTFPVGR